MENLLPVVCRIRVKIEVIPLFHPFKFVSFFSRDTKLLLPKRNGYGNKI